VVEERTRDSPESQVIQQGAPGRAVKAAATLQPGESHPRFDRLVHVRWAATLLAGHRLVKDDLDGGIGVQLGRAGGWVELDDLRRGAEASGEENRGCEERGGRGAGQRSRSACRGGLNKRGTVAFSTSIGTTEPTPLFTSIRAALSAAILATPVVAVLSARVGLGVGPQDLAAAEQDDADVRAADHEHGSLHPLLGQEADQGSRS